MYLTVFVSARKTHELLNQLLAFRNVNEAETVDHGAEQDDLSLIEEETLKVISSAMWIIDNREAELLDVSDDESECLSPDADFVILEKPPFDFSAGHAVVLVCVLDQDDHYSSHCASIVHRIPP